MTKHKWHDVLIAIAEGNKVEHKSLTAKDIWLLADNLDVINPITHYFLNWRIKKEPVIEVVYLRRDHAWMSHHYQEIINPDLERWDLKITYQDGKAIKAELPE